MAGLDGLKVALVHDYLNQRGGAERVVLECSGIWPSAPIYTSLYRPDSTFEGFKDRDVRPTLLNAIPVDRGFRNLFPLYPPAFGSFGDIEADVVLASSSGWAHMARSHPDALHVVYCHTPARWLYRDEHLNVDKRLVSREAMIRPARRLLRRIDQAAAQRADVYVANSENVRRRIEAAYGIDSVVVPPPVDVERFRPSPRGSRLLVVSRLLRYKHVDLFVRAATRHGLGLDVVGEGPVLPYLQGIAGPTVAFHGSADDRTVVELMESCRAVCVAAEEDFGIVPVEAQAAGKPVVAFGRGGALETVEQGVTGAFFYERTEDALLPAIAACDRIATSPDEIARRALRFSRPAFRERLIGLLSSALARKAETSARNAGVPLKLSAGRAGSLRSSGCERPATDADPTVVSTHA
jgi:glycosyltransferase involved in cell wall biosynthesis